VQLAPTQMHPSPRLVTGFVLLAVTAGALALRLPALDRRPMHGDEAVHAVKFQELWENGRYRYDPHEFHGPTLNYFTLPAAWLGPAHSFAETTETTYRIVPALFGAALVLLLLLLADGLGRPAAVIAGVLTAVSPAMVFYSRYYIQETLLVFFTLGALAAGWRYVRSGRLGWAILAGGCVGLMQATKETSVIAYAAMAMGGGLTWAWGRMRDPQLRLASSPRWPPPPAHLAAAAGAAILVAILFFSSFFTNFQGTLDAIRTYQPWFGRSGTGSVHAHPWHYYLHLLAEVRLGNGPFWTEALIPALALTGFGWSLSSRAALPAGLDRNCVRFIGFYAVCLTLAYSLIPYKTPWCLLSFLDGMILLAGVGAVVLVRAARLLPVQIGVTIALLAGAAHLAWQADRAVGEYGADNRNPYVYAHPVADVVRCAEKVEAVARARPRGRDLIVKVVATGGDYWPLPWYLRKFQHVGYWSAMPEDIAAPLVIGSADLDEALTKKLNATHLMTGFYGLRPTVMLQLWVEMGVWEAYVKTLTR
jgi:uncharacterized protein (TIGR03663 family)